MMEKYIEFNPIKFLNDSKNWSAEKKRLRQELESLTDITGVQYDGMPHSTKPSNPTLNSALRRQHITSEISKIEYFESVLAEARKVLFDDENEVLDIFFFKSGYMPPKIDEYGYKYGLCRSDVYKARRQALEHLSRIITEHYA